MTVSSECELVEDYNEIARLAACAIIYEHCGKLGM